MNRAGATAITAALLARWPLPSLDGVGGKEDRGCVLVVGGSRQVAGAVLLAGEAVLRAGAGKLQVATAECAVPAMCAALPEAKWHGLATGRDGGIRRLTPDVLRDADRSDAVLVGPGMSACAASARLADTLLARCRGTVVFDAGALDLPPGWQDGDGRTVLTPHAGEMARLAGLDIEHVQADPRGVALAQARASGCITVLKGPVTHIASPDGKTWVHRGGSVGLGTSGSGDVLAGLITGLAARGASPVQAAAWGVWLHGRAGTMLARRQGRVGFLAREIAGLVPRLLGR